MRVRDVLKKLGNDEQALIGVAERAKTSDRQIPLAQRYAEVLATWDEYVEPMIQLVSADGAFEQGVRRVEQVLLRLLGEQQRSATWSTTTWCCAPTRASSRCRPTPS